MAVVQLYLVTIAFAVVLITMQGLYAWRQRRTPGALTYMWICAASIEVAVMFFILTTTESPEVAYASARLRFFGLAFITPLFVIFVLQYTRQDGWLTPTRAAALMIVPLLTQIVLWLTPGHTEFLKDWQFVRLDGFSTESRTLSGWYNVYFVYSLALAVFATVLAVRYVTRVDSSKRSPGTWMIVSVLIGLLGSAIPITVGPEPGLRFTPVAIGIASAGVGWALLRFDVLRVIPVAYDQVFSSIDDAVLVLDPDGIIIKANPEAQALFRLDEAQMTTRPSAEVMTQPHRLVLTGPKPQPPFLYHMEREGKEIICQVRNLPLMRAGRPLGRLIVLRDITAQKQEEAKALELALERERTQVLAQFIEAASHQFRSPISVIKSSGYLLRRSGDPDNQLRHIEQINDQADRVMALVDDLQFMAALDTQPPRDRQPVDLNVLIRQVLEAHIQQQTDEKHQTLVTDLADLLPSVPADSEHLTVAITKILDNAVRYTPKDGTITVRSEAVDGAVQIVVTDTGIGMDADTLQRAAQRFFRHDTDGATVGFGLGLPMAKKIIELHGGSLTLTSTPDKGTTARIFLPLNTSQPSATVE